MADSAAAANGTTVTAVTESDGETTAPPIHQSRAQRDAEMRAAFLAADVEADLAEEAPKPAPKKPAPKVEEPELEDDEPEETAADDDEEVDVDDDDDLDDDEDADEDVEKDDPEEGAEKDAELQKRFQTLRKREQRMRQQLSEAQHNAAREFEQQKQQFITEVKPLLEDGQRYQSLKAKKHDIAGVLKELGYVEDDFEEASQILWGLSKTGSSDPKNKAAAARLLKDREIRDEARKANARAEALEQKLAARDAEQEAARRGEQYMARVAKAVGDAVPLVKKRLELQPKSSAVAMNKIALALMDKNGGQVPDPKKVVAAYEKKLRAQRELALKLGGDEAAPAPASAKGKPAAVGGAKPAGKIEARKPLPTEREAPKKTLLPSRTEMIENLGKLQRGEIQFEDDN